MANPRTLARLQERIRERAAYCLQFEVNDPRASFITITRVQLSPDYGQAKIFYSVLGDSADKSKAEHMLAHAGGFIQRQTARVLELRRVPHMVWIFDGSSETAADMDRLIREARERDRAINPALGTENEFARVREDQPSPAERAAAERAAAEQAALEAEADQLGDLEPAPEATDDESEDPDEAPEDVDDEDIKGEPDE